MYCKVLFLIDLAGIVLGAKNVADYPGEIDNFNRTAITLEIWAAAPEVTSPWALSQTWKELLTALYVGEGLFVGTGSDLVSQASCIKAYKSPDKTTFPVTVVKIFFEDNLFLVKCDDPKLVDRVQATNFADKVPALGAALTIAHVVSDSVVGVSVGQLQKIDVLTQYRSGSVDTMVYQLGKTWFQRTMQGAPVTIPDTDNVIGIVSNVANWEETTRAVTVIPSTTFLSLLDLYKINPDCMRIDRFFTYQPLNPAAEKYFKLDKVDPAILPKGVTVSGVLVSALDTVFYPHVDLQKNDIVLAFNGIDITSEAEYFCTKTSTKLPLRNLFAELVEGDEVKLLILRDGKVFTVEAIVYSHNTLLMHEPVPIRPRYLCYGDTVFRPLTKTLVNQGLSHGLAEFSSQFDLFMDSQDRELIVGLRMKGGPPEQNAYIQPYVFLQSLNDIEIINFQHFIAVLNKLNADKTVNQIAFRFSYSSPSFSSIHMQMVWRHSYGVTYYLTSTDYVKVFDKKEAEETYEFLKNMNNIPAISRE